MTYTLFRIGDRWHYRFQLGRNRVQKTTGEKARAKADAVASRAWEDARARYMGDEPTPTVSELALAWLGAHEATHSTSHCRSVRNFAKLHLYGLGSLRLDQVSTAKVEEARVEHLKGRAPATANLWLRILKMLFKWAVARRMLPPADIPWTVKQLKVQKRVRVVLAASSVKPWLAAVDKASKKRHGHKVSLAVRLMLLLGLREMEALQARWEWVDWERNTYTPGMTKGREAWSIPLTLIRDYLEPLRKASGWMVEVDGAPPACGFTRKVMRAANKACAIEGLTNHRLRGSFATLLSEAGLPLQDIQRLCRHKDWRTTAFYLEVDHTRQVEVMTSLKARITKGPKPRQDA
jgi:integrase